MAFRFGKTGPLIIIGIAVYVLAIQAQGRAAENLCKRYSAGSVIRDIENLEGTFLLTRMASLPDPNKPAIQSVIFCASMTMCDTSCRLEIEGEIVTNSRYSAL